MMAYLPLTNKGRDLRWKYRAPITALILARMFAAMVAASFFGIWLSRQMGIPDKVPVRDLPNGPLFSILFVVGLVFFVLIGYAVSFVILARWLRWRYGWTKEQLRELIHESSIPAHWLKESKRGKTNVRT